MTDFHVPMWKEREEENDRQMRIVAINSVLAVAIVVAILVLT
jgi:hypothetical protein